ncbi:MAG: DUF362 domain-containing protein [Deltaproteobacteria bacterium]|nr:DUF362 domain-containing protein [Deltaproteobacteria bacterium]
MNRVPEGLVAAVRLDQPTYPDGADSYSPGENFPELPFPDVARTPNAVYAGVRRCLRDSGLDHARFGTPEWNPFGAAIAPGARVFVLCNFVYQRRPYRESHLEFLAKCTHAAVIRPVVDYLLKAVGPEGHVEFGCAPVQGAVWSDLLRDTGSDRLLRFYDAAAPGRVRACDLRGDVVVRRLLGWEHLPATNDEHANLDLGPDSELERAQGNRSYRSLQYDAQETARYHAPGSHVYALSRRIAAADAVVSIPKLKTHEKVGHTGALKGCVGATTLKQCLAHHRKGSPQDGGDEYADGSVPARLLSELNDYSWQRRDSLLLNAARTAERVLAKLVRESGRTAYGSWSRNDTCWRMALDIARCVAHARPDGNLDDAFRRPHLVVTDGVIGGEGKGPLRPSPVATGFLSFARDPYAADLVACRVMGFDPERLPLLREATRSRRFAVTTLAPGQVEALVDGRPVRLTELGTEFGRPYRPARGWEEIRATQRGGPECEC